MLSTNAFPTAQSGLIDFLNYPLGTSSFLYYVCYRREGTMLLAQGILIFAFFYAVLGAVRHSRCFLLYALLGAGLSLLSFFNITIRINNLLVDFLLPVIALACWAVIRRYPTDPEKMLPLLLPYQALLLIVKSTGAIYVAFVALAFLFRVPQAMRQLPEPRHGKKPRMWEVLLPSALTLLLSFSSWAAWQYHTKTALAGTVNKFDTNLVEVGAAVPAHICGSFHPACAGFCADEPAGTCLRHRLLLPVEAQPEKACGARSSAGCHGGGRAGPCRAADAAKALRHGRQRRLLPH